MRQADGRELFLAVTGAAASSSASTAEAFRKLRTNLAYMDVDHPPRIIVVTSPKQSDGKSTIAANLAAAIAIGGQPVTLIDGDLRRPTVADSLAIVDGAGLTDVLVGRVKAEQVMQDHPDVPGLRVMASGAIPPNPSELLGSHVMATLIADLSKDAMVVIDAPPLLPVTDAAVLTRAADGAIIVVTHGGTLDSELRASHRPHLEGARPHTGHCVQPDEPQGRRLLRRRLLPLRVQVQRGASEIQERQERAHQGTQAGQGFQGPPGEPLRGGGSGRHRREDPDPEAQLARPSSARASGGVIG